MSAKRWIALVIFIILFIALVGNAGTWQSVFDSGEGWEIKSFREGTGENLALIDVSGLITASSGDFYHTSADLYNHNILLDQLETAFRDDSIEGIIMRFNSPGGSVTSCDEVFQRIVKLKEEHGKPLVAYMDNIAASGAYLISATSDVIFANRNTFTGALGVILTTYNFNELAENWGVKEEVFKSGPFKNALSPFKEVNDEERVIFQDLIDESYHFMIESILKVREMDREKLLNLADGRIYSGPQALENGLIDELGFLDEAIDKTAELAGTTDPNIIHYTRTVPSVLDYLLGSLRFPSSGDGKLNDFINLFYEKRHQNNQHYPSLMYLWSW